jgi:hypothetical protein
MSDPLLGPSPAQITMMGHTISARIAAAALRRRRRRRIAIATVALGVGAALTAAAIGVATAPPAAQTSGITCFLADDARGEATSTDLFDEQRGAEGAQLVTYAIEQCAVIYGLKGLETPDPVACELPDLRLAVFPNLEGTDASVLCRTLGLGPAPTD